MSSDLVVAEEATGKVPTLRKQFRGHNLVVLCAPIVILVQVFLNQLPHVLMETSRKWEKY